MKYLMEKVYKSNSISKINNIQKILCEFEKKFEEKIPQLIDRANKDYLKYSYRYEIDNLRKIIKKIKNEEIKVSDKIENNGIKTGIGNMVCIYNGIPEITLTMILYTIKTQNKILLCVDNQFEVNKILVEIIKEILEINQEDIEMINITNNYADIANCQEYVDKAIFVGSKYEYINLRRELYIDIEYNGYGYMSLYYDSDENISIIQNINAYAIRNFIEIDIYNDKDIEKVIERINYLKLNEKVIIFSKNKNNIIKFALKVKADEIVVNKNKIADYKFEITQKSFIREKKIEM
jgi:hypothetical protein